MKKVYILLMAAAYTFSAKAQSAPGAAPTTFKSCNSTCTAASSICAAGSPNTVTNFNDKQYITGTGTSSTSKGAQWKYYNVAMDASTNTQVNAIITIEQTVNAVVSNFDDDGATDQNNNTMPNLFAPTISANSNLTTTDRAGYVQFRITFYKNTMTGAANKWNANNYAQTIELTGLNYVHYDIDGTSGNNNGNSYELRETGVVQASASGTPAVTVNANSELNSYNYTADGSDWKGFMGSTCNRDNTSKCAEVVAAFKFNGAFSSIVFRMGYNYDRLSGNGANDAPGRLYASTFGCFSFPQPILLPVRLLSFSGTYSNNATQLSWETEAETNFDHYEIERSTNGSDFTYAGRVAAQSGDAKKQYEYADNIASISGNLFYYRLKMVDIDAKFKYSNVILIRRDAKSINGISVSPNPIIGTSASTVRLSSTTTGKVDLRVIDLTGKVVLQQQSRVSEGMNSISINNINRLQSGIYTVQVLQNDEAMTTKISVLK
ncbi:MAG: T9SS type A sorting domain-containing protein [Chitinophagaceae bacterium]